MKTKLSQQEMSFRRDIAKRLRAARREAEMTIDNVASMLNVSRQLVNHWEHARSTITVFDLRRIGTLYGTDSDWLLFGGKAEEEIGNPGKELRSLKGRVVPKVQNLADLLHIATGDLELSDVQEFRHTYADCSESAFSFEVFDRALEPSNDKYLRMGTIVTVDPERLPEPGDCILVALRSTSTVVFRRYRPGAPNGKIKPSRDRIDPPFKLAADNPNFEIVEVTPDMKPVFLGTMVEYVNVGST